MNNLEEITQRRMALVPLAIALVLILSQLGCKRTTPSSNSTATPDHGLDAIAGDILPWIQDQKPFLVSPDSRQLLIKTDLDAGDAELRLEDLETRQLVGHYTHDYPLLIAWRPKSNMLSFVADHQGDRRFQLKFWTPADGNVAIPDVPLMSSADRLMRWSPDGRYLAFRIPHRENVQEEDQFWLFDTATFSGRFLFKAHNIIDYRWSPDGSRIAVVSGRGDPDLTILNSGSQTRTDVPLSPDGSILWAPDGDRLFVAAKEAGKSSYGLQEIYPATGKPESLVTLPDKCTLAHPLMLRDGRMLFHMRQDRMSKLMMIEQTGLLRPVGFDEGENQLVTVDENQRTALVDHTGITQSRGLYRVTLDQDEKQLIFQPGRSAQSPGAPPTRVMLSLPDGTAMPIYVWRSGPGPSKGVVIKFPTPGYPDPKMTTYNGATQYLLQKGYDYIAFNLPPSDGDEATTDSTVVERDIVGALAVIDYAHGTLGTAPDNIVMIGESAGTTYVTRVAARMKDKRGGLVLRGVLKSLEAVEPIAEHSFRIVAFHGENELFTPAEAKLAIEDHFGARLFSGSTGLWQILKGEGHNIRRLRSRALITAAAARLLMTGAPDSGNLK